MFFSLYSIYLIVNKVDHRTITPCSQKWIHGAVVNNFVSISRLTIHSENDEQEPQCLRSWQHLVVRNTQRFACVQSNRF